MATASCQKAYPLQHRCPQWMSKCSLGEFGDAFVQAIGPNSSSYDWLSEATYQPMLLRIMGCLRCTLSAE